MIRLRQAALFVCVSFLGSIAAYPAEQPDEPMKTTAIAAFKNGLAFVMKQGDVRLESGVGRITPVPGATLGTLWLAPSDPGTSIEELVAYHYKVPGEQNVTTLAEVLLANVGKTVTVIDGSQKEFTGEIVGVRDAERSAPEPTPVFTDQYSASRAPLLQPKPTPEFLLLKSEAGLIAIRFGNIQRVVLPKDPVLLSKTEEERRGFRVKVKGGGSHANLTMGYLEHGLGWTPSYLVTLQDDKTAQITMQAVLVDDAEDIKNADVFFVVGVPNFQFAHIPSPMAMQQSLYEFMQAAARRDGSVHGNLYSNAILSQRAATENEGFAAQLSDFGAGVDELSGASQEDLFLYTRPGVTLARGERGTYNVFSGNVAYEHVYEWEIQDEPRVDAYGNAQTVNRAPSDEDRNLRNNIWHTLRMKNATNFPWTSAPTMVMQGAKPVAQDTLPYTPKGATSTLKLTIATDIRPSHEEREVERQRSTTHRQGYTYDLVTVEGKFTAKNYKSKEVHLLVTKSMRGTMDPQTDMKVDKLAESISADNPMSRAKWDLTLKAGEEKTVTYRYKVWVRV
jgi:hypothetical protein